MNELKTKTITFRSFSRGTQQQTVLLQTKDRVFAQLEDLINIGVDKYVNYSRRHDNDRSIFVACRALLCIVGYVRNILNEQKRSDFKPESDLYISECSQVCWKDIFSLTMNKMNE